MNLNKFLTELAFQGVKLWTEDDQLRYRAPKGVLTPEARDLLALHKAELILLLHQRNMSQRDTSIPLVPGKLRRDLPLSFAQERMWFLSQLEPTNPFYNELLALRLQGSLNVIALEQSLNKIITRHEALRTNFASVDGLPAQVIAESLTLSVPVLDLRDLSSSDREIACQQFATTEAQRPFDLTSSPLIQANVLKLTEVEHILLLKIHHIVYDGWSCGIIIRELATIYSAFCNDLSPELRELPIQYTDFAVWQRVWLTGVVLLSQLAYWTQQLEGAPALLELPTDRVRPSTQTFRGAHQPFTLSKEQTLALIALSQRLGVTLFMTLLAAFQTLLYRYTGQTDICVGTAIANRTRAEIEGLIGFFVNTLVLRTDISGNPSFEELLYRVREVALGAYAHQDLPFEKLVEQLQPARDLSHTPLCQVMLVLDEPMPQIEMAGLTVSLLAVETATAKFDLTLALENTATGLIGNWEYNTDLFDASTIARMARHFQTLLERIVANPEQRVSELPLLEERERHQLLVEWNNTTKEYPIDKCIHQLFEEQVTRSPDAIAVVFEDKQLTYRELNQRANCLAHHLKTLGVEPEVLVGICVERSLEMIVGLLGILKAGGAYVPLDPAYPFERLSLMIEDAQPSVLLTQERLVEELPSHWSQVICLDSDWEAITHQSQENPSSAVKTQNLAYVIYTSGSTGKPKGVLVTHHNLSQSTYARIFHYSEAVTSFLLLSSFAFDSSVAGIFWTLCSGGILVLPQQKFQQDLPQLTKLIAQNQVSHLLSLPSLYALILEQAQQHLESLRTVILAGEPCPTKVLELHTKQLGHTFLFNEYGPTEATVWSTVYKCQSPQQRTHAPIGRPIANTSIYILDRHLQPVPIGVPGEVHIGGAGVARGYLNHPELTLEKFIPNPFSNEPGERLYKTGDQARYLTDGNIEFLGRLDNQVKIRGFRIELGEIEAVLNQHPDVQTTTVIAREDIPGDKRLVAYVVPNSQPAPTFKLLRHFLKQQLPEYMVPSNFVMLEALPLTPNGKVDRRELLGLELNRSAIEAVYVAPITPVEKQIVAIWSEILGIKQIGVGDNFFNLGGHSLLVTLLMIKVRKTFQVELPLRSLFEMPTVAELAASIEIALQTESAAVNTKTVLALEAEAILDLTIRPDPTTFEFTTEPDGIFLTGSTGFVGAFLLDELIKQTEADIYCLVRTSNLAEGKHKIRLALESYLLWNESNDARIIPVLGDLAQPLLGLSEEQFHKLASQIDLIYHCGAWVNHTYPYHTLKAANVLGTQEVLRLASTIKVKPVHFISTTSVFSAGDRTGGKIVREQDSLDVRLAPTPGYAQSKWVAEKLVTLARERGIPVAIYRLGRVSGHSQTGVFNANDLLYKFIIGCLQLGSMPEWEMNLDIIPVDYVSKAIARLSSDPESLGQAFHLIQPNPVSSSTLFEKIRSLGYPIQQVSYDQWYAELMDISQKQTNQVLSSLVPFFPADNSSERAQEAAVLTLDCQNTLALLANTSIVCPAIDDRLLSIYFSYLLQSSYLNAPELNPELS